MNDRLLTITEVRQRVGASRSSIYAWVASGLFPQPVRLGERLSRWRESEIAAWIAAREPAKVLTD